MFVGAYPIELGHRRLAILDLDTGSNQPMSAVGERYRLVFNGEIYNYIELRDELRREGHTFQTVSDSEVLITAWHAWGPAALKRMIGMFAFVLLDLKTAEIISARDPFGIKPLYFAKLPNGLALASEPATLLQVQGVSRTVNSSSARLYISRGITDAGMQTLFADIFSFPAAHYARVDLSCSKLQLNPIRFWEARSEVREEAPETAAERIRTAFLNSVKLHLRSDVPVGIALSGGLDSSAIAGAVRAITGKDRSFQTFSFVTPGDSFDETSWIDLVAQFTGYDNHKITAPVDDFTGDLDALIQTQGEPFGSLSIYAQSLVMKLARDRGVKVVLDGQGGDELFGGYRLFLATRIAELLRRGEIIAALRLIASATRQPDVRLPGLVYNIVDRLLAQGLPAIVHERIGRDATARALLNEQLLERPEPLPSRPAPRSLIEEMIRALTEGVLPALLRYEDRNSMHQSIEARVPFLTTAMAETALSCEPSQFIAIDGTRKAGLRRALRGIIPDAVIDRRDKVSFAAPERSWLIQNDTWCKTVVASEITSDIPLFKPGAVTKYYEQWRDNALGNFDTFAFWRILNFVRWSALFNVTFH